MKTLTLTLAFLVTGCSTMDTHLKTGCIWTCAEWAERLAENPHMATSGVGNINSSYQTVSTPGGVYSISTIGNSTSISQISKTR